MNAKFAHIQVETMKQLSNLGITDRGGKKKARNPLAWLCGLMALAASGGVGATTLQQLPKNQQTGYMVEVHTCLKADSGTDSLIEMELDIRDPNWNFRTLKGWTQDHTHKLSTVVSTMTTRETRRTLTSSRSRPQRRTSKGCGCGAMAEATSPAGAGTGTM